MTVRLLVAVLVLGLSGSVWAQGERKPCEELKAEIEALRSLIYRACEDYIGGTDVTMLASMAKLKGGRLMRLVADSCLQYWGGMGYMTESPVSRAFRDTRLMSIGGGADEVMLQIISKMMGTLPRLENN